MNGMGGLNNLQMKVVIHFINRKEDIITNDTKGICRVKDIQIAWYDMEYNGDCFDEDFENIKVPTEHILAYVETEEDRDKINHSRVFINMDNGDKYELIMRKCESDCTNFNDK